MPSKNKGRRPVASRGKSLLTPEATEPAFSITAGQAGYWEGLLHIAPYREELRPASICCLALRVKHYFS